MLFPYRISRNVKIMIWFLLFFFFPVSSLFITWLTIVPPAAEHDPFMSEFIGSLAKEKKIWQDGKDWQCL